jgi:hypothetical protein
MDNAIISAIGKKNSIRLYLPLDYRYDLSKIIKGAWWNPSCTSLVSDSE